MIINGGSYRARGFWVRHIDSEKNDSVRILGMTGLDGCKDLAQALKRMEIMAYGTRAENFFDQSNLSPAEGEWLTDLQAHEAADMLKRNLGLDGHASVLIEHVKGGEQHFHLFTSRIDREGHVVRDSFTAQLREQTSREIEERFDLQQVQSVLVRDRETPRPERRAKKWETFRAMDTGITPEQVAAEVQELRSQADNGRGFVAALDEAGYIPCRGDKRVYCILDRAGDEHSLNRRVGMPIAAFKEFMQDVPLESLPSMADAKKLYAERQRQREQEKAGQQRSDGRGYDVLRDEAGKAAEAFYFDRDKAAQEWQDGLDKAAIQFEESRPREQQPTSTARPSRKFTDREFLPIAQPSRRFTDREKWLADKSAERAAPVPENGTTAAALRYSVEQADQPQQLAPALQERGFRLAQVTREDTGQPWPNRYAELRADAKPAKQQDDRPAWQQPKEGELVAVNQAGHVYRFNERNSGKTRQQLDEYLSGIDRANLPSVTAAKAAAQAEQEQARAAWIEERRIARQQERAEKIAHHETVQHIGQAYFETTTGAEFVAALQLHGLKVGRASERDVERADVQHSYGIRAQALEAGDYVAMNEHGHIYKLDATTIVTREEFSSPQYEEESRIKARLAEIDSSKLADVTSLRAQHEQHRQDQLAAEHAPLAPMQTTRAALQKSRNIAGIGMDLAGEFFDMAGSAARVASQFLERVMEGPSHAISGGTEQQKAQANAVHSAREQAKARAPRRQADRPADHSDERASMKRALELLEGAKREKQAAPAIDSDDDKKKKRDRGDRER